MLDEHATALTRTDIYFYTKVPHAFLTCDRLVVNVYYTWMIFFNYIYQLHWSNDILPIMSMVSTNFICHWVYSCVISECKSHGFLFEITL